MLQNGEIPMIELNERMKQYMQKCGWKHIVLNVEEVTS